MLDPNGIAISTAADGQWSPGLAFDGTDFLVVWGDRRSGPCDIYGTRVTPAGVVLDSSGIAISTAADDQWSPALAFDGTNFLVVWQDSRSGSHDIYGTRVTPGGVVLDTLGIAVSTAAKNQRDPALAFDDTNFLVVWEDYRSSPYEYDICGARVTPAGSVLDPSGIAISTATKDQRDPALVFDGTNFLVVWEDYRSGDTSDICGARVTPQGVVLGSGLVVQQDGNQGFPVLAHGTGSRLFLVYQGWAGTVGGKTYNTQRIWGDMDPFPPVRSPVPPQGPGYRPPATIVRGVLFLGEDSTGAALKAALLDVGGSRILDLLPGENDVRGLAPGVYFAREEPQATSLKPQAVRKVVITR